MRNLLSLAAILLAPVMLHGQAPDEIRDAEVRDVVRDFHAALTAGDSARALGHLHPEVVIYEGGHAETLAEYRSGHLGADIAFAGAVRRAITGDAVTLWRGAALYTAEAHTTGRWRGRDIDAHGAESIVLVETAEGWRIRHIHWSSR